MSRSYKFNPDRIRCKRAEDRRARKLCAGVLKMLQREIKDEKRKAKS